MTGTVHASSPTTQRQLSLTRPAEPIGPVDAYVGPVSDPQARNDPAAPIGCIEHSERLPFAGGRLERHLDLVEVNGPVMIEADGGKIMVGAD
ncbi:MAG TPA: hypothetical protein VF933_27165 [Streptosporangiaceae bacterium]